MKEMPRVLIAVEQLRRTVPGGIGSYARGLLAGLDECAHEGVSVDATLLASRVPGHLVGRVTPMADPLSRFGHPVIASRLSGPMLTRCWDRGWVRAPMGFDVVHSVSLAAPLRKASDSARSVVTVHDMAWRRHPEATTSRGRKWHEAALGRACDSGAALIVPSRFVAADLLADGVDSQRVTVVQGGSDHLVAADMEQTAALLHQLGVPGEFVLTVSTLEPRKNVDRLLRAYQKLRPSLPEPWPLVIVGPTGWGPALPTQEAQEGVVFTGKVPEAVLTGLYRKARAFAYVPLTEGYGLPPLEAMRLGLPTVVANEVPSVRDLDQTGAPPSCLVDPFDVDDIAEGMAEVLTDEAVRTDLAVRGEAYSRTRTWHAAAEQHVELWRSLT